MSEVVDVINPRDGVESNFLKNATKSTAVKPFPLNNGNSKEKYQQISENDKDLHMAVKARKWIGVLINKEFDGKRYMGQVVNYCGETNLYKVEYENDVCQEVDYQELQQIVAPPPLVCQYLESNPSEIEKEKKKRQVSDDTRVPIHPRRHSSSAAEQAAEPRKRKCKRVPRRGSATSYIPLAFRETKKDAYYYYYY